MKFCPSCAQAPSRGRFCTRCGKDLDADGPPAGSFPAGGKKASARMEPGPEPSTPGSRRALLGVAVILTALIAGAVTVAVLLGAFGEDGSSSTTRSAGTSPPRALAPPPRTASVSEEEQARRTVEAYLAAVTSGDGERACSLVTESTRRNIQAGGSSCAETIGGLSTGPSSTVIDAFRGATVENVRLNGDRGTADIKVKRLTQKTNLRKEDGEWLLDTTGLGG